MKNFEALYNAWLDGELRGDDLAEFERLREQQGIPGEEKARWSEVGEALRVSATPRPMPHGDFVTSQILRAIENRETPSKERRVPRLARLVWCGIALLLLALLIGTLFFPGREYARGGRSQVILVQTYQPHMHASAFEAPDGDGAVLWLSGMPAIPADQGVR